MKDEMKKSKSGFAIKTYLETKLDPPLPPLASVPLISTHFPPQG